LIDELLEDETARLLHAYGRIQELRAAAHPKKSAAN